MPVSVTSQQREMTALLSGDIDHHSARGMMEELDRAIGTQLPLRLVLDLSAVTFMDSSGLAVLIRCKKRMDALGGSLRAVGIPPQAGKVLDAAGLGRLIQLERSRE